MKGGGGGGGGVEGEGKRNTCIHKDKNGRERGEKGKKGRRGVARSAWCGRNELSLHSLYQ